MNLNLFKQINPAKNSKLNHQAYTPKKNKIIELNSFLLHKFDFYPIQLELGSPTYSWVSPSVEPETQW